MPFNPLFSGKINTYSEASIITENPYVWSCFSYIDSTMAADDLMTRGAVATADMVLI